LVQYIRMTYVRWGNYIYVRFETQTDTIPIPSSAGYAYVIMLLHRVFS